MQAKIAIVILNWNGKKHLEQFLPSVLASTYARKEVIVADNASTDDSISFLTSAYPSVRIIRLTENYGFARGYNEALKQVEADYYVLLNSDVEVQPGWIEPVIQLMDADSSIAACQPKLLSYSDRSSFEYAGACGGWLDHLGYPFTRGRIFDYCEQDKGQYDNIAPVFWATGAAMFVRTDAYRQLGGLDEYFFAHQEEIDLCWRLQLAGYKIMACPSSVVYHVGGGTLPKGNKHKVYLNFRNNLIMLAKNLPATEAVWKIPLRLLLDHISGFKTLLGGQVTYYAAICRAHNGFLRWWLLNGAKRRLRPTGRTRLSGWYSGSVIWKHFIQGKKTFTEIIDDKA
ncbi:MAG TPA: glycosyltransferase family 2 protein [Chitinophagaceae bacterium]|nr:glycosyltransferase family 2 protein [Chitinophagaceae bacterium]